MSEKIAEKKEIASGLGELKDKGKVLKDEIDKKKKNIRVI